MIGKTKKVPEENNLHGQLPPTGRSLTQKRWSKTKSKQSMKTIFTITKFYTQPTIQMPKLDINDRNIFRTSTRNE